MVQRGHLPVESLVEEIRNDRIIRVPGTAVFMSGSAEGVPVALLHHLKHNKALHQKVILLTVQFDTHTHIPTTDRCLVEEYHDGLYRVILRYGFAEHPSVSTDLPLALVGKLKTAPDEVTYYQSREVLHTSGNGKMTLWRKKLFVLLSRISRPATGYFDLPPRQVIELGIQLEL